MGFGGKRLYYFKLLNYVMSTYDKVDKGCQINSIYIERKKERKEGRKEGKEGRKEERKKSRKKERKIDMSHGLHFACSALTCYPGCPALALIEIQMTGNGKGWGWGWAPPMWFPKGFGKGGWGRRRGPRILGRPWPLKAPEIQVGDWATHFPKGGNGVKGR
jgi:hypothetical protein